ncbi:hypothetical protein CspeluHIS016_0109520 [Cutaneotrichosporon spelunceum]|uniref:Nudix hydrolase domain-containing protein n=1 Tax=Cutaneotrichosporon spelunceum TaxID=1672016 RepID=A0AAD3Y8W3_9TREE|nr:hypothetical protein CspeluHIS016_0109520 [Cutaneotrichosporon spelunceum]
MVPPISATEDLASGASSGVVTPTLAPLKRTALPTDLSAFVVDASMPREWPIGLPAADALTHLSANSRACVENFAAHTPAEQPEVGQARRAAVLIAVYQPEGTEDLRVLLTTRAKHLRRNPGQTALPGGKVDEGDPSPVFTARREAFEEAGLPLTSPHVHVLTVLDPVLTVLPMNAHLKNHIVVTPVVAFISDPELVNTLRPNPEEVECIFDHPLKAIHTGVVEGELADNLNLSDTNWWPGPTEFHSLEDVTGSTGSYRMHRFRTCHTPIRGFTSDVIIRAAAVGFGDEPEYGHYAPDQPSWPETIDRVVQGLPAALTEPDTAERRLEWRTATGVRASGQRIE